MKTMSKNNKGLKVKRTSICLDSTIMKIVDEQRGLIKRSTYIDYLLKLQLLPILKERGLVSDDGRVL